MKLLCSRGMLSFCGELYGFADVVKRRFPPGREYRGRIQSEKWISNLVRAWSICCTAQFRSDVRKRIVYAIRIIIFILRSILHEYET